MGQWVELFNGLIYDNMSVGVAQYRFSRTAVGRHFFAVLGSFVLRRIALDDSSIEAHVQHQSKSCTVLPSKVREVFHWVSLEMYECEGQVHTTVWRSEPSVVPSFWPKTMGIVLETNRTHYSQWVPSVSVWKWIRGFVPLFVLPT